jgi:hypothetical protein
MSDMSHAVVRRRFEAGGELTSPVAWAMLILHSMSLTLRWMIIAALAATACSQPTPEDAAIARTSAQDRAEAMPDTVPDIIEARVPAAVAGDTGWRYQQQVVGDIDGDGDDESVVLIADVMLDAGGQPLWEDGHRWQVYVREQDGRITRVYARFLPNGSLTVDLAVPPSGAVHGIVLIERTPNHLGVYELRYRGPDNVEVYRRLDREIDTARRFTGSPRP